MTGVRAEKGFRLEDVDKGESRPRGTKTESQGGGSRGGQEEQGVQRAKGVRGQLLGQVRASPQWVWSRQLAGVAPASWQMMAYPLRTWQRSSSCSLGSRAAHRSDTQCLGGGRDRWGAVREGEGGQEAQTCRRGPGSPIGKWAGVLWGCVCVCACV